MSNNIRVFVWAALALTLWFNYQQWKLDYGPKPTPPSAAITAGGATKPPSLDDTVPQAAQPPASSTPGSPADAVPAVGTPAPAVEASSARKVRVVTDVLVLDIDLRGVFLCMKYEIPLVLAAGGGAIINTSSGAGVKGFAGGGAYGAAKHGVIGLTRCAALDYAAANVRINAICPGIIETPMMDRFSGGTPEGRERVIGQEPVGRMGRPEEIASAVMWLCSDNAAFTVGHALVVDGGQTVG